MYMYILYIFISYSPPWLLRTSTKLLSAFRRSVFAWPAPVGSRARGSTWDRGLVRADQGEMLASKIAPRAGLWHLQQALRPAAGAVVFSTPSSRSFGRHPKHDPRIIPADKPLPRLVCCCCCWTWHWSVVQFAALVLLAWHMPLLMMPWAPLSHTKHTLQC